MKYYVYFTNSFGNAECHCFEQSKEEAEHFAKLVHGEVRYCY